MAISLPKSPLKSLPQNLQRVSSTIQRVDQQIVNSYSSFDQSRSISTRLSSGSASSGFDDILSITGRSDFLSRSLLDATNLSQLNLNNIKNLAQGINIADIGGSTARAGQPTPVTSQANLNSDVIRNLESQLSQGNFKLNSSLLNVATTSDPIFGFLGNVVLTFSKVVGALNSSILQKNIQQFSSLTNRIQQPLAVIQQTQQATQQIQQSTLQLKSSISQLKTSVRRLGL
jgi:hypothetical protein